MSKKTEKIHCNKCGHETNNEVLLNRTSRGRDDRYQIDWSTIYDVFECLGCEDVSLRRKHYFSEWGPGEHEEDFYPPRIARRLPKWKTDLSSDIEKLLEEVYTALQADSKSLAMMGARALIDMVIVDKVGDAGSFPKKLTALENAGYLSAKNRATLEAALDVGNAASHRGHRPKTRHVQQVMDIVENLLQSTLLQEVVDDLKDSTPSRGGG